MRPYFENLLIMKLEVLDKNLGRVVVQAILRVSANGSSDSNRINSMQKLLHETTVAAKKKAIDT